MKKSHRNVRFAILWFNRSRSYQNKSVQYHHILTIEGEIALLSLYCKNCSTSSKNWQEKRSVCVARFLYHVKKNNKFSHFFNLSSQDRFLKKSSGKTPQNRRVVNFFFKDYVRYSVNITVHRSQTDIVSFSSGAIWLSN